MSSGNDGGGGSGGGGGGGGGAAGSPPAASLPPPLAGFDLRSDEILARITCDPPTSLLRGPSVGGEHTHAPIEASLFNLRGPGYHRDGVKRPSAPAMFDLMHVEFFRSESKIGNVAARSDSWLRKARAAGDTRYYYCVLYVTTASPFIHLCAYFAVQPERVRANPHFEALWRRFTAEGPEGDAFRTDRWKVVPSVSEGPWAVQYAVGTKPALLATKLAHTWVVNNGGPLPGGGGGGGEAAAAAPAGGARGSSPARGRGRTTSFSSVHGPGPYLESDCDVASSNMALILVSLIQGAAK
jgi:hypothetical protein